MSTYVNNLFVCSILKHIIDRTKKNIIVPPEVNEQHVVLVEHHAGSETASLGIDNIDSVTLSMALVHVCTHSSLRKLSVTIILGIQ